MDGKAWEKADGRLKRIAGQVEGIGRMIEEKRYCMDILQQIASVRSSLDNLGVELLTQHLDAVLVRHDPDHGGGEKTPEQHLAEVQQALSRFLR